MDDPLAVTIVFFCKPKNDILKQQGAVCFSFSGKQLNRFELVESFQTVKKYDRITDCMTIPISNARAICDVVFEWEKNNERCTFSKHIQQNSKIQIDLSVNYVDILKCHQIWSPAIFGYCKDEKI